MVIDTLTVMALVVNIVVVLLTLGKISRQLDKLVNMFTGLDKKLSGVKHTEELSVSQLMTKIQGLETQLRAAKGDIDWKG